MARATVELGEAPPPSRPQAAAPPPRASPPRARPLPGSPGSPLPALPSLRAALAPSTPEVGTRASSPAREPRRRRGGRRFCRSRRAERFAPEGRRLRGALCRRRPPARPRWGPAAPELGCPASSSPRREAGLITRTAGLHPSGRGGGELRPGQRRPWAPRGARPAGGGGSPEAPGGRQARGAEGREPAGEPPGGAFPQGELRDEPRPPMTPAFVGAHLKTLVYGGAFGRPSGGLAAGHPVLHGPETTLYYQQPYFPL